jgi:RIO-like serine/threonine protein kinase
VSSNDRFDGPWFDSQTACAYVCCKTMSAWYEWRRRHRIVPHGRLVAKADIDRELKLKRIRRMSPASLANLRRRSRHALQSGSTVSPRSTEQSSAVVQ